jgi:predicted transcriptional regulator
LNFANTLATLAAAAPDDETKQIVYKAIHTIRRRNGWTTEEKRVEILRVISLGASTYADIRQETQFNKDEVEYLVKKLENEGLIVLKTMSLTGGAGRPPVCIFPKS